MTDTLDLKLKGFLKVNYSNVWVFNLDFMITWVIFIGFNP